MTTAYSQTVFSLALKQSTNYTGKKLLTTKDGKERKLKEMPNYE